MFAFPTDRAKLSQSKIQNYFSLPNFSACHPAAKSLASTRSLRRMGM